MKDTFYQWVVNNLIPKRLLHFAVIKVWAIATTGPYRDKTPYEVDWDMALKSLE